MFPKWAYHININYYIYIYNEQIVDQIANEQICSDPKKKWKSKILLKIVLSSVVGQNIASTDHGSGCRTASVSAASWAIFNFSWSCGSFLGSTKTTICPLDASHQSIATEFMELLIQNNKKSAFLYGKSIHPSVMYPTSGESSLTNWAVATHEFNSNSTKRWKNMTVIGENSIPNMANMAIERCETHALAKFHGIPWGVAGTISFVQLPLAHRLVWTCSASNKHRYK